MINMSLVKKIETFLLDIINIMSYTPSLFIRSYHLMSYIHIFKIHNFCLTIARSMVEYNWVWALSSLDHRRRGEFLAILLEGK